MNEPGQDSSEVSPGEDWYDAEIAPALRELATRCHEKGMGFVSVVEYKPGARADTVYLNEHSGIEMRMVQMLAAHAPNIDGFIISLMRHANRHGIDTSASIVLRRFGK